MGLLDFLFQPPQQAAPQAPAPQGGGGYSLSPLATSLLAGYFSAIGSPKLAGVGGAVSRGGLGALSAYSAAQHAQQQQQLQDAYMRRALAQADKADAASKAIWKNTDTNALMSLPAGEVPSTPGNWIPATAIPSWISAQGKDGANWKVIEYTDPTTGEDKKRLYKPSEEGQFILGGQPSSPAVPGQPGQSQDVQTTLPSKSTQAEIDERQAMAAARNIATAALSSLEELKAAGKEQGTIGNWISAAAYKAGFSGPETEARDWYFTQLDATKQQLMAAALKSSGNRALGFIKIIQDHFPSKWFNDEANRGRLQAFIAKGGILDQWDHFKRASQSDPNAVFVPKVPGLTTERNARSAESRGASATRTAPAPPPPPPVIPVGDPDVGPNGELVIKGIDGNNYLYSPGVGWRKIR